MDILSVRKELEKLYSLVTTHGSTAEAGFGSSASDSQILWYGQAVKMFKSSGSLFGHTAISGLRNWELSDQPCLGGLSICFKHGMMWCSLISHKVLLVRRCGTERITHNETCILACDGLWFVFFHQLLGMMIIPFPFNYNTVEMGWNDPPTRFIIIPFNPTIPLNVSSRELVMSDESWIWVRCTGGCVCKCYRRPGYFGWQRRPVDPWWQIHGRLWWLWASGQWCFGTLNEPMIAMVQWSMIYTYKYKATVRAWSPDQGYRALSVLLQESICQKLPGI